MEVQLVRKACFSSGHRYYRPELSEDQNKAIFGSDYSEDGLGHNFVLEAYFTGPIDPITGMIANLSDVDRWLKELTDILDHRFLNEDVDYFKVHVPSAENIARYCFEELKKKISLPLKLARCRLYEGEDFWVDYSGEERL